MSNIVSVEIEDFGNLDNWLQEYPRKVYDMAENSGRKAGREGRKILIATSPGKNRNMQKVGV